MPMSKRLAAEFIGTLWLVLGVAAAPCWPRHFRAWASVLPGSPWHSASPCGPWPLPSAISPAAISIPPSRSVSSSAGGFRPANFSPISSPRFWGPSLAPACSK